MYMLFLKVIVSVDIVVLPLLNIKQQSRFRGMFLYILFIHCVTIYSGPQGVCRDDTGSSS